MDKTAFVLLLIFSNIVPLLAWGSTAQVWNRRKSAPVQAHAQRQRRSARSSNLYSYTTTKQSCQNGGCVYPAMCHCPKPQGGGYERYTNETSPWYYNNATKKCEPSYQTLDVCNHFRDEQHCLMHCAEADKWLLMITKGRKTVGRARP
uniref:Pancreatic trypsin inhibitor n=1 Tax=Rhipicephalus zambeziensis TaxID=60191 RepID=A0A224Y2A4_9ACAR